MSDSAAPLPGPIFYLTGEYPRATDTFIQREVAALRALGADVRPASIRRTGPEHHITDWQKREAAETFNVLATAKSPLALLGAHARLLARAPGRWVRAWALAVRMRPPGLKGLLWQIFYALEAGVLADRMQAAGAVHLHNHFGDSSCSVAVLAAEMAGLPYSYTMHGPGEFFEPMRWRIDIKIARAAFVAAISHFARGQGMIFADQAHWDRIKIVHCGVDPALYPAPEGPPGQRLLFVGRLAAIKGVVLLLEAVAALAPRFPELRLVLVGDGPEAAALKARASDLGIAERVRFTGYLGPEGVAEELARADLFVLPSFAEGVPVVLMEAMAAARPVIAPHVAGVPELVEDGVSGFLAAPGDLQGLIGQIETVLSDPEAAHAMGRAGRAKVVAEFDSGTEAAWLLRLFQGAVSGKLPDGVRPE
jgi:glycosyltransferase involved in cell wall biosynthesis